jgi:hypothetical protein
MAGTSPAMTKRIRFLSVWKQPENADCSFGLTLRIKRCDDPPRAIAHIGFLFSDLADTAHLSFLRLRPIR